MARYLAFAVLGGLLMAASAAHAATYSDSCETSNRKGSICTTHAVSMYTTYPGESNTLTWNVYSYRDDIKCSWKISDSHDGIVIAHGTSKDLIGEYRYGLSRSYQLQVTQDKKNSKKNDYCIGELYGNPH